MSRFLNSDQLPYCKGCGHNIISKSLDKSIDDMGLDPIDIILVTDIGCQGIIDRYVNSHTVHGLHGRSAALATGISLGMKDSKKKIIVFIGDGGVTIGLQHILEAIRRNIDITVIVHNNMLYGMTGGQASGLTPSCFKTTTTPEKSGINNYDICSFARISNASYVTRTLATDNLEEKLTEGINTEGFSLIEVVEICPSYGVKYNKGINPKKLIEDSGQELGIWKSQSPSAKGTVHTGASHNLLENIEKISQSDKPALNKTISIVLSGSAGEAVQSAANYLSLAGISSGLSVNKRGRYPVTVGVGFSSSEIILSPEDESPYQKDTPEAIIVSSIDGMNYSRKMIEDFRGILIMDSSLESPETDARVFKCDLRTMGAKHAALYGVFYMIKLLGIMPVDTLTECVRPKADKFRIPIDSILENISGIEKEDLL